MKNTITLDMSNIIGISNTLLKYKDNENVEQTIDLKESAGIWWKEHNKETLLTKILRKKQKNIYVGNKEFGMSDMSYIELYTKNEQICFVARVPDTEEQSAFISFREKWKELNIALNKEGYWLFDMS